MKLSIKFDDPRAEVEISRFGNSSTANEFHIIVKPLATGSFSEQLDTTQTVYLKTLEQLGIKNGSAIWRRFFLSDVINQCIELERHPLGSREECAVSMIGQAPMNGSKMVLLAYHVVDNDSDITQIGKSTWKRTRGKLQHVWSTGLTDPGEHSTHEQTVSVFDQYTHELSHIRGTLLNEAVRTWLHVRDVDHNYAGVVSGRNEVFDREGLNPHSHYIASTGIEARLAHPQARVSMDTYSVSGLSQGQIQYLQAADYLSRTDRYGVRFERATAISYQDRKHIFISGTASIDSNGEVLHKNDVVNQLARAIENVDALLKEAKAGLSDMQHWLIYLRDPADSRVIKREWKIRMGDTPSIIVAGSVCRPDWLIEVEGLAIVENNDPGFPQF